jgi:hypothetical protein
MKMNEIIKFEQPFPTSDLTPEDEQAKLYSSYVKSGNLIKQISASLSVYQNDKVYSLVKDTQVVGILKIVPKKYFEKAYTEVELVYVTQKFRKSPAIRWMLYAVREITDNPLLIDGVVFTGGERIIDFVERNKLFKLSILDKTNGDVKPYDPAVNDMDLAIVLETADLGFGKDYIPESVGYVWFNLEQYLGTICKEE